MAGKKKIAIKNKGALRSLGYSSSASPLTRHKVLIQAVKVYGQGNVEKKLNAISTLNKSRNPGVSRVFKADYNYVKNL